VTDRRHPSRRRSFLPRGLLARSGLLIFAPFITLQLILIVFFWFGHWQPLTDRLTRAVADELDLLITGFESGQLPGDPSDGVTEQEDLFVNLDALTNLGIRAASIRGPVDPDLNRPILFSTLDRQLRRHMGTLFPGREFAVDTQFRPDLVLITVDQEAEENVPPRHYRFLVDRGRLFSEAGINFLFLILIVGFLILIPSFLFLRGQVRPIRNLAREASAYGRGAPIEDIPVRGATEVRQATRAFRDMRARITRAVEQRTNMLSGVSHDLRTPLTRLKLQLALMEPGPDRDGLEEDVTEMEAMLEGYLDYARGNVAEDDHLIILADLVQQTAQPGKWPGLTIHFGTLDPIAVKGRRTGLLRLLNNVLSNAQRHADAAWVSIQGGPRHAKLIVQDNGPGIPEEDYERVLQPFQRLDEGRNLDEAGVGLGLTVCQDIARSHGGDLTLAASPQGGLQVTLRLPA